MRIVLVLVAVVLLTAGCGSKKHGSGLFSSTVSRGDSPAGPQAGGPPKLVAKGSTVTGKGLLVVRANASGIVVRNPNGGTLTLTRHTKPPVRPGERVSFTGTRNGSNVVAKTLSITGR